MLEINKIYCGDAAILMKEIPNNFINLTITSPPYDGLRDYKGYSFDFETIALELYRVTKQGGVVVWVVGDATINGSETGTSFRQALFFMKLGFNLHDTMVYKKLNFAPLTHNRYEQEWEYMFVFSKGKPKTFNPIKIPSKYAGQKTWGKPSYYKTSDGKLTSKPQKVIGTEKIKGNVWEYRTGSTQTGEIEHPAVFPEKLAEEHILSWTNKGDLVFDPMCGSGTTCKMAQETGRAYIGIDISEEYCKIAKKRTSQKSILSLTIKKEGGNGLIPADKSVGIST